MDRKKLYESARLARRSAYAPYSSITVGATLLTRSGKVYTGANIENAAYSPSVCAERVAFFKAISDGERDFAAIAVAGGKADGEPTEMFPPCGVCRQVMAEFCDENFKIILGEDKEISFNELLPYGFNKDKLK